MYVISFCYSFSRSQTSRALSGVLARFTHDAVRISYDDDTDNMVEVSLAMPSAIKLNDGQWHYMALLWEGTTVELKVDSVRADTADAVGFESLPQ